MEMRWFVDWFMMNDDGACNLISPFMGCGRWLLFVVRGWVLGVESAKAEGSFTFVTF